MASKHAVDTTTHVVKSSTSLNFFSNAAKSTVTQTPFASSSSPSSSSSSSTSASSTSIPTPLRRSHPHGKRSAKPNVVRSTIEPIYPFINMNEVYKLQSVLRRKLDVPYKGILSSGRDYVGSCVAFPTHREALGLASELRDEFYQLQIVSAHQDVVDLKNIDLKVTSLIEDALKNGVTHEALVGLLEMKIQNEDGHQITSAQKMGYLIENYLNKDTIETVYKCVETFVLQADNPQTALRAFTHINLSTIKLGYRQNQRFFELVESLYNTIIDTYPALNITPDVRISYLDALIHYKRNTQAYQILVSLSKDGYSPTPQLVAKYIKNITIKKGNSNTAILQQLLHLDNVIFTTISPTTLKPLLAITTTIDEISSLLDLLQLHHPDTIASLIPHIESDIVTALSNANKNKAKTNNAQTFATRLAVLTRIANWSPWCNDTKKFIIKDGVKAGMYILPRILLDEVELTDEEKQEILRFCLATKGKESQEEPGRDALSLAELVAALEKV
ncbi:CYFA0S41e00291g1_1 [Cyberlindnera fabianii]|uniref:ATPase expression protein 1 n=1 Tax=Cyberlindnera fabianii TaxID=36022 RepID=A0A061BDH1_CYBFA|nr:CYFA0S41e00291g1_1 [Cyberlindnera fabianii]